MATDTPATPQVRLKGVLVTPPVLCIDEKHIYTRARLIVSFSGEEATDASHVRRYDVLITGCDAANVVHSAAAIGDVRVIFDGSFHATHLQGNEADIWLRGAAQHVTVTYRGHPVRVTRSAIALHPTRY